MKTFNQSSNKICEDSQQGSSLIKVVVFGLGVAFVVLLFGSFALTSDQKQDIDGNTASTELSLSDIHGLEVDIDNPNQLYLPNHQGLYEQLDDGTISKVGENSNDFMGFSLSPTYSSVFYASGHPKTGGNFGLIRSDDGGVTWQNISDGLNGPVDFHTMAVGPKNDDHIYGYYAGALQRSLNGGETWESLNNAPNQIIQLSVGDKEGQLYAATANGLYVSNDKGDSWELFAFDGETVIAIEVNLVSGQLLSNTITQGLMLSHDSGETWVKSNFNMSDTVIFIASSKSKPETSYLITKALKIYKSNDSGLNWSLR